MEGPCAEDAIKNNFVIIYELLDEILDHGFPQITSADVLKSYITQEGVKSKEKGAAGSTYGAAEKAKQVSMQVTGAVQWRRDGLKYKKNEVYLDIIESVSLLGVFQRRRRAYVCTRAYPHALAHALLLTHIHTHAHTVPCACSQGDEVICPWNGDRRLAPAKTQLESKTV